MQVNTRPFAGGFPAIRLRPRPIFESKSAFVIPLHELSDYSTKFHLEATDQITGRVKGQHLRLCNTGFVGQNTHQVAKTRRSTKCKATNFELTSRCLGASDTSPRIVRIRTSP